VVAISAESVRTFALTLAGRVLNWGKINNNGWVDEIIPPSATNVIAIDAGQSHTLALLASGTVIAWGQNGYHQLDVPPGLHDVTAICDGPLHNLALTVYGSLFAWGDDSEKNIPSIVTNVVAIAAGFTFDLALVPDGDEKLPPARSEG
jgi:alpha-tubulin suppressor-like RCC1 family protein